MNLSTINHKRHHAKSTHHARTYNNISIGRGHRFEYHYSRRVMCICEPDGRKTPLDTDKISELHTAFPPNLHKPDGRKTPLRHGCATGYTQQAQTYPSLVATLFPFSCRETSLSPSPPP